MIFREGERAVVGGGRALVGREREKRRRGSRERERERERERTQQTAESRVLSFPFFSSLEVKENEKKSGSF